MTDEELKTTIAAILKDDRVGASYLRAAIRKLRAIGDALEAALGSGAVQMRVEVGELTLYGKQCSLFMVLPNAGVRDLLLRVYVRPSGPPMMLELFNYSRPVGLNGNHQPLCSSIDEMEATILAFLATEDVKQGLLELKDVAA